MLSENLKQQTLQLHQQTEKKLVALIKSVSKTSEYVNLLQLFYTYFGGLEDLINEHITTEQLPDKQLRRKTEALAKDLDTFGAQPEAKAADTHLPKINNPASALGALYVIEGSTLGGSIISKMIAERTGIDRGLSFFYGYGDRSMQMWGAFKNILNGRPAHEKAEIIRGANDTFLFFSKWIDRLSN